MRKPKFWYAFRWECNLHEYSNSNMIPEEKRHNCKRPDKKGNIRPVYDLLKCSYNACPFLKDIRKSIKDGTLKEPVSLENMLGKDK